CLIRLLSTLSHVNLWCKEYRYLSICWLGLAYFKLGHTEQSIKIFSEVKNGILDKNIPCLVKNDLSGFVELEDKKNNINNNLQNKKQISVHVYNYIKMLYYEFECKLGNDCIHELYNMLETLENNNK